MIEGSEEFNSEIEFHQLVEACQSIKNVSTIMEYEMQFLHIEKLLKQDYIEKYYGLRITSKLDRLTMPGILSPGSQTCTRTLVV